MEDSRGVAVDNRVVVNNTVVVDNKVVVDSRMGVDNRMEVDSKMGVDNTVNNRMGVGSKAEDNMANAGVEACKDNKWVGGTASSSVSIRN